MSLAEFSQNIHSFVGNSFANSFQAHQYSAWESGKAYIDGNIAISNNGKYIAVSSGTSGAISPSHVDGVLSDGGVDWLFVESILQGNSYQNNLFLFSGKLSEWDDENDPPEPALSDREEYDVFSDIIAMKRITNSEIKLGIKRVNWTSGTVYSQYDNTKRSHVNVGPETNGYSSDFYVVTPSNYIYKCLDNNNGSPSVSMPNSQSTGVINTGDGYVWKFMADVSAGDASRFMTQTFVPVEHKTYDDTGVQWDVQINAQTKGISTFKIRDSKGDFTGVTKKSTIVQPTGSGSGCTLGISMTSSGAMVRQVIATSSGSNYEPDTFVFISNILAVGSGATADAITSNGVITGVTITSPGSGYTGGAIALVLDQDGPGHGAILSVTGTSTITAISVTNGGTEYTNPKIVIIPGTVGCLASAVIGPINGHGSNIVTELGANLAIISCQINDADYFLTGNSNEFRQIGIITDILDSNETIASEQFYIGPAHPSFSDSGSSLNKIKRNSGHILYLNNTTAIVRASDQEEHIKISMAF